MQLLVVRHAKAYDREDFAKKCDDDRLRPLTPKGIRQFLDAAHGLHKIVPKIDAIWSSDWMRARQTAEILGSVYWQAELRIEGALQGNRPTSEIRRRIDQAQSHVSSLCLVGHNPHLDELVAELDHNAKPISMKKGSACLFDLERDRGQSPRRKWYRTRRELTG